MMEITITRVEQVGPTVAVWGTDGEREVMVQHFDLPPTKEGIFSALYTALTAPPFVESPAVKDDLPHDIEPVRAEPVEIDGAALDAAVRVARAYQKLPAAAKHCVFTDAAEAVPLESGRAVLDG